VSFKVNSARRESNSPGLASNEHRKRATFQRTLYRTARSTCDRDRGDAGSRMSTQQGSQRRVEQSKVRSPSRGRSTRTCSGGATQWTHLLFLAMHLKALDVPPLYVMLLDDDDTLVPDVIKMNLTTAASQAGDFRLRNNTDYSGTFMPFDLFWRDMLQFIRRDTTQRTACATACALLFGARISGVRSG
jgi:hypothetical protein